MELDTTAEGETSSPHPDDGEAASQRGEVSLAPAEGRTRPRIRSAVVMAAGLVITLAGLASWLGYLAHQSNQENMQHVAFVDQTITIGQDATTDTASSIRITLDNVGNRWLISGFEPI